MCKNDKLIEMVCNPEFVEVKKKTRFAKLIEGTDYARYSIENDFLRDSSVFIEKKSGRCDYMFTIVYSGHTLGVWTNWHDGKIFIPITVRGGYAALYNVDPATGVATKGIAITGAATIRSAGYLE